MKVSLISAALCAALALPAAAGGLGGTPPPTSGFGNGSAAGSGGTLGNPGKGLPGLSNKPKAEAKPCCNAGNPRRPDRPRRATRPDARSGFGGSN